MCTQWTLEAKFSIKVKNHEASWISEQHSKVA